MGSTETPIASTVPGVVLFGGGNFSYFAMACFIAYGFSGKNGLYASQRFGLAHSVE